MAADPAADVRAPNRRGLFSGALSTTLLRYGALALIDAFAIWLIANLFADGFQPLAITLVLITLGVNVIFLVERLYPFKWLSPGMALMILMVVYPVLITVYYAFTNYRTGNLLTEPQAIEQILRRPENRVLPEGAQLYGYTPYQNTEGGYLLLLEGRTTNELIVAPQGAVEQPLTPEQAGTDGVTFSDDGESVTAIDGYTLLSAEEVAPALANVTTLDYGYPVDTLQIGPVDPDAEEGEGYVYDPAQKLLADYTGRRPTFYTAQVFRADDGRLAFWLVEDGGGDTILLRPDHAVVIDGVPQEIDGYRLMTARERTAASSSLVEAAFGNPDDPIQIDPFSANRAARFRSVLTYDAETNALVNQDTGVTYRAVNGTFTLVPESVPGGLDPAPAAQLRPGYYVTVGLDNFTRLFQDQSIWGPFFNVFLWTVFHAAAVVFITFALGMGMALLLNDDIIPARKFFRSVILIPYAIPAFISVVVWRGILDPNLGVINNILTPLFGSAPNWYGSATAARVAILIIQLWLGFPYMMLIITGALQGIPGEIYEAAVVDGANAWQKFRKLTLPLVLVAVGPLLIASFAFNFNNFTVIQLFNRGGPAIPGSSVPTGFTDILITYTYRQAFGTAGGTDYAFASTISILIFMIVAAITIFNFRFTAGWEEISKNV
jgi:ABC-type sugar transport system permease subunit